MHSFITDSEVEADWIPLLVERKKKEFTELGVGLLLVHCNLHVQLSGPNPYSKLIQTIKATKSFHINLVLTLILILSSNHNFQ